MTLLVNFNAILGLIDYLDSIIGASYSDSPLPWTIAAMLLIWLIYQMFTLLYSILGIHK